MFITEGYFYYIKNSFFSICKDPYLMANFEDKSYRPHFYALRDNHNPNIIWMVPVSSKYEKYQSIFEKQVQKYGHCSKIILGKCNGRPAAFLIQNAFPILPHYLDHIHTSHGKPLKLHSRTQKEIVNALYYNLKLHKHGVQVFFTDIERIYHLMEDEDS